MPTQSRYVRLTPYQEEKFYNLFKFFEPNEDDQLVFECLDRHLKRIQEYTGWESTSPALRECREVFETFFEIFFDKVNKVHEEGEVEKSPAVSFKAWLAVWSRILPGCMGVHHFPIWLRLLPKQLFKITDRNADGFITEDELSYFYEHFFGLPSNEAKENATTAYSQMTDKGRYPLNLMGYEQIFANFLLGHTPFGPGRHIFGPFQQDDPPIQFRLIEPLPPQGPEDEVQKVKIVHDIRLKRQLSSGNMKCKK